MSRLSPLLTAQVSYRLGPALRKLYDPKDFVNEAWSEALRQLPDLEVSERGYTPALLKLLGTMLLTRINDLVKTHIRHGMASPAAAAKAAGEKAAVTAAVRATAEANHTVLPVDTTGVITTALRREAHGAVAQCLDELEPRDREALLLRGIEQHSNRMVGLQLGLSPQAVAMKYRRAVERLRDRLPGSVFEEMADN